MHNQAKQLAMQAALEAGKQILGIYNTTSFEIQTKGDNSPLTKADIASNEVINKHLQTTNIPIISEENEAIPYLERKNWEYYWVVDPLDGTKEFIKRNGEFTVNIALCHKRTPIYGVIYVPVTKELYVGDVTIKKAFKIIAHTDAKVSLEDLANFEIKPKPIDPNLVKVVGSRSHMNADTEKFVEGLKQNFSTTEIVAKGSSLKFCLVAEGLADVYPRFAPTMEWDTAAGHAICTAVGLKVISKATNAPLAYNKENLLNDYFLVSR